MPSSRRGSRMFLKKNKKKSLALQEDLNSRLVAANRTLMRQMEEQQQRDTVQTMEQQQEQGKLLRKLMRTDKSAY